VNTKVYSFARKIRFIFILLTGLGFVGSAGADCFQYVSKNGVSRTIKNVVQKDLKRVDVYLGPNRKKYGIGVDDRRNVKRYFYLYPKGRTGIWVPRNGYLVVDVAATFKPEIVIDNGKRNIAYSFPTKKRGKYYNATVTVSGDVAHSRGGDGYVNVNFTSMRSREEGRVVGWISLIKKRQGVSNKKFVALDHGRPCESSGKYDPPPSNNPPPSNDPPVKGCPPRDSRLPNYSGGGFGECY